MSLLTPGETEGEKARAANQTGFLEQGDALDVGGVRKHVHHPGAALTIAVAVHQLRRVAGERRWIAAHIDDALRAQRSHAPHCFQRTGAWRIEQDLVEALRGPRPRRYFVAEIGGMT